MAQHAKELEELTLEDVLASVDENGTTEEIEAVEDTTVEELKPTVQTKVQTAVFIIVWLNQLFNWFGMPVLDIDPNMLYTVLSGVATFAGSFWNYWFNNSWTPAAIFGDRVKNDVKQQMKEMKEGAEQWQS